MKKFFISGNKNKYLEIIQYIPDLELFSHSDIPEIQSLDIMEIIKSKLKMASTYLKSEKCLIITEDTGLYLKALNGFPGPLIKFMLKSIGNEGIYRLCQCYTNYKAEATTAVGIYDSITNDISFFSATIDGLITSPKGNFGFGWDQIFIPNGSDKTFAEMTSIEEKNVYSMRFKALTQLLDYLTILR